MIVVRAKALLAAILLTTFFWACSRKEPSPILSEAQALQAIWSSDAELTHTDVPRQNANEIEKTWNYQFSGGRDAAMKLFQSHTPAGYTLVRQTHSELSFARWDGHDSYQLTLAFDESINQTTKVSVRLKSFPD